MFIFSVLLLKKWQRCVLFFLYKTKIDLFSLSILLLFVLFCIPGICIFGNSWKKNFFLHSWSNNQLLCSILRKIFMMRVDDYERIIIDWPDPHSKLSKIYIFLGRLWLCPKNLSYDTFEYKIDIFHISCFVALLFLIILLLKVRACCYFLLVNN